MRPARQRNTMHFPNVQGVLNESAGDLFLALSWLELMGVEQLRKIFVAQAIARGGLAVPFHLDNFIDPLDGGVGHREVPGRRLLSEPDSREVLGFGIAQDFEGEYGGAKECAPGGDVIIGQASFDVGGKRQVWGEDLLLWCYGTEVEGIVEVRGRLCAGGRDEGLNYAQILALL